MIRVFVGCAPNGEDAESQAVLEYTLRKHASVPVEIIWMRLSRDPASPFYSDGGKGWQTTSWSTPFTGFRFLVPALCAFKGRAIYTDSDVIFMADIAELWAQQFKPGRCVLAKTEDNPKRLCISLWDCAVAKPFMPVGRDARALANTRAGLASARAIQAFAGNWNCIDGENYTSLFDEDIKIIHYSLESAQPHLKYAIPRLEKAGLKHWFDGKLRSHWREDLIQLFNQLYADAIAVGFTLERYLPEKPFGTYQIKSHEKYGEHEWAK